LGIINTPARPASSKSIERPRRKVSAAAWVAEVDRRGAERRANYRKPGPKPGTPRRRPVRWDPAVDKPAAQYWPVRLNPEDFPARLRWYLGHVLNLIHFKAATWRADADGFVRLNARLLAKVIPSRLLPEVRGLLRGIAPCDNKVAVGRKSLGYRLSEAYRQTRRVVCPDPAFNARLKALAQQDDRYLTQEHKALRVWFDRLQFDLAKALSIIATLKPRRRKRKEKLTAEEYRRALTEQAQQLVNGDHWLEVCEYGRVHTPITCLPAALRCCLRVGGESLINVDLPNSQPLLLGLLTRQWLGATPWARRRLLRMGFTAPNPYDAWVQRLTRSGGVTRCVTGTQPAPAAQPVLTVTSIPKSKRCKEKQSEGAANAPPPGLTDYLRVCLAGGFYEWLMTPAERARGKKYRGRFKRRFMVVMFARNEARNKKFPNRLRERFRRRCPAEAGVLAALKRRNFRHSAHLLQSFESTIFIHLICGRILRDRPDVPLFTIHDSLLTTRPHVAYVRRVIEETFIGLFGVTPRLREEVYA
jgi:hypothetical protein